MTVPETCSLGRRCTSMNGVKWPWLRSRGGGKNLDAAHGIEFSELSPIAAARIYRRDLPRATTFRNRLGLSIKHILGTDS
jgi:hypothetical protein